MKKDFKTVLFVVVAATALVTAGAAHAQGATIDPNGFLSWFADLFSGGDAGARIDGNG